MLEGLDMNGGSVVEVHTKQDVRGIRKDEVEHFGPGEQQVSSNRSDKFRELINHTCFTYFKHLRESKIVFLDYGFLVRL